MRPVFVLLASFAIWGPCVSAIGHHKLIRLLLVKGILKAPVHIPIPIPLPIGLHRKKPHQTHVHEFHKFHGHGHHGHGHHHHHGAFKAPLGFGGHGDFGHHFGSEFGGLSGHGWKGDFDVSPLEHHDHEHTAELDHHEPLDHFEGDWAGKFDANLDLDAPVDVADSLPQLPDSGDFEHGGDDLIAEEVGSNLIKAKHHHLSKSS